MALNIPQLLASFTHKDKDTQRQYDNTAKAVNPLLGFVKGTFVTLANGMLRIIPDVLINNYHATGNAQVDGNATVNGTLNVNGVATLPNITTQKVNATSVASSQGFKAIFDMGYYWNSSAVASTRYRTNFFTQNSAASSNFLFPTLFQPIYSGSILGIQTWSQGTAGGTAFVELFKNTTAITGTPLIDTAVGPATNNYGASVSYAKGQFPFAPQDYFCTSVAFGTGGNQCIQVRLYVEFAA